MPHKLLYCVTTISKSRIYNMEGRLIATLAHRVKKMYYYENMYIGIGRKDKVYCYNQQFKLVNVNIPYNKITNINLWLEDVEHCTRIVRNSKDVDSDNTTISVKYEDTIRTYDVHGLYHCVKLPYISNPLSHVSVIQIPSSLYLEYILQ